jgi:hypothetical protein
MEATAPAQVTNLFSVEDLDDAGRTTTLAEGDLDALRAAADWIKTFVAKPHKDLGRRGTVCPFVPGALERQTLWLAPEHIADRRAEDVVELVNGYRDLFLHTQPVEGDGVNYKSVVVVFTDLPADRAKNFFDELLARLGVPSYADVGVVLGAFYERNEGTAIYNPSFRPFTSPVPFLIMRQAVVSDWKFFVNDDGWLSTWAHRFGESGAQALGEELRPLPWNARRD